MSDRVKCCVPECRRSFKEPRGELDHEHDEVMCGRCWRTVDTALRARHKLVHARSRRALRLVRLKSVRGKPGFANRIDRLEAIFMRACQRSWLAIKADAVAKSALRLEGTAGELAARADEMKTERDEVDALTDELFHAVQKEQGYAHVSDGETFATKAEFFRRIRGRLEWSRAATRRMRAFLKKHGELPR
jgi:hypothetical protein